MKCFIKGDSGVTSSSLFVSTTESWDQVIYKVSLKVNRPQLPTSKVYNEYGVEVTNVAELEDGDKIYFAANGEAFVPPKVECKSEFMAP